MDFDPFKAKRWEAITHLPFDEQIRITFDADTPGFIRGATEVVHKHPVDAMGGFYTRTLPLERIDNFAGTDNSLHEQVNCQHKQGWLELGHTRSLQDPDHSEVAFEEVVVRQHVSDYSHPQWFRGGARNSLEEFEPTPEEEETFRTKWLRALVEDNARKKRTAEKAGGRAIQAVDVKLRGEWL